MRAAATVQLSVAILPSTSATARTAAFRAVRRVSAPALLLRIGALDEEELRAVNRRGHDVSFIATPALAQV